MVRAMKPQQMTCASVMLGIHFFQLKIAIWNRSLQNLHQYVIQPDQKLYRVLVHNVGIQHQRVPRVQRQVFAVL